MSQPVASILVWVTVVGVTFLLAQSNQNQPDLEPETRDWQWILLTASSCGASVWMIIATWAQWFWLATIFTTVLGGLVALISLALTLFEIFISEGIPVDH